MKRGNHNHHMHNHGMHKPQTKLVPTPDLIGSDLHKHHDMHHENHHIMKTAPPYTVSTVMESLLGLTPDIHKSRDHHQHHRNMFTDQMSEMTTQTPIVYQDENSNIHHRHHHHHGHHTTEPDHHAHPGSHGHDHHSHHSSHPEIHNFNDNNELHTSHNGARHDHGSHHGAHGSHHAAHGTSGHGMQMVFSTHTTVPLLFEGWPTDTVCGLTLALVGSCLLALIYEGLLAYFLHLPSPTKSKTRQRHVLLTILHMVRITMGYILMLCAMTYNLWILLTVVLGAGLGHFFVRPLVAHVLRRNSNKNGMQPNKEDGGEPILKHNNNCDEKKRDLEHATNGFAENTKFLVDTETVL